VGVDKWGELCACIDLDTERREKEKDVTYVEILIARSVVFSSTGTFMILYTAFRVCPVRMHAHSAGISS
jgi:hypothetical protein